MDKSGPPAGPRPAIDVAETIRAAARHLHAGEIEDAERLYRRALEADQGNADALAGLGETLMQRGDLTGAVRHLRQAVERSPRRAAHHLGLAMAHLQKFETDEAVACARRALALDPRAAAGHGIIALAMERLHRLEAAAAEAQRALDLDPAGAHGAIVMARVERRRGDAAAARRRIEALLAPAGINPRFRSLALTELGHACDALEDVDAAYEAFSAAGALTAGTRDAEALDRGLISHRIERYRSGLTADLVGRWTAADLTGGPPAPAFLVGFPRSGTTLMEQVLGAHPAIVTTAEEDLIAPMRQQLGGSVGDPEDTPAGMRRLDRARIMSLRERYWAEARSLVGADPDGPLLLDKLPLNIVHLGLVNAVFPDAPIIVALRDPRDCCLSAFMQSFSMNLGMVNLLSLDRTTAFYAEVMGLYLHLRPMLTLRTLEVRYEDTVDNLRGEARRMLELLQLPWDDDVLRFYERSRDRVVKTPSYEGVARPVHRGSVGRWWKYQRHLAPWLPRLAPFIEAFGYGAGTPEARV